LQAQIHAGGAGDGYDYAEISLPNSRNPIDFSSKNQSTNAILLSEEDWLKGNWLPKDKEIKVFDISGKVIFSSTCEDNSTHTIQNIKLSPICEGTYWIRDEKNYLLYTLIILK